MSEWCSGIPPAGPALQHAASPRLIFHVAIPEQIAQDPQNSVGDVTKSVYRYLSCVAALLPLRIIKWKARIPQSGRLESKITPAPENLRHFGDNFRPDL